MTTRSGINIRIKRESVFRSYDVVYDLSDNEFKKWVLSKIDYDFSGYTRIGPVERYKIIEDMIEKGIYIFIDKTDTNFSYTTKSSKTAFISL